MARQIANTADSSVPGRRLRLPLEILRQRQHQVPHVRMLRLDVYFQFVLQQAACADWPHRRHGDHIRVQAVAQSVLLPDCAAMASRLGTWGWLVKATASIPPASILRIRSSTGDRSSGSPQL